MATQKPKPSIVKGSKAACEAAGWQFLPLTAQIREDVWENGRLVGVRQTPVKGARGIEAVPPAGCGIEPRHFGGAGRAVAWAVEQLGKTATGSPDLVPAGMDGIRMLLNAALASGAVCGGPDETPERPDARLLAAAHDVVGAEEHAQFLRNGGKRISGAAIGDTLREQAEAARALCTMPATTRQGLIWKARAALAAVDCLHLVARERLELLQSLALDLIEMVPTLIDDRGRAIMPTAGHNASDSAADDSSEAVA